MPASTAAASAQVVSATAATAAVSRAGLPLGAAPHPAAAPSGREAVGGAAVAESWAWPVGVAGPRDALPPALAASLARRRGSLDRSAHGSGRAPDGGEQQGSSGAGAGVGPGAEAAAAQGHGVLPGSNAGGGAAAGGVEGGDGGDVRVYKPPSLLLWLPDYIEPPLSRFFKQGEAVTYIAGGLWLSRDGLSYVAGGWWAWVAGEAVTYIAGGYWAWVAGTGCCLHASRGRHLCRRWVVGRGSGEGLLPPSRGRPSLTSQVGGGHG